MGINSLNTEVNPKSIRCFVAVNNPIAFGAPRVELGPYRPHRQILPLNYAPFFNEERLYFSRLGV